MKLLLLGKTGQVGWELQRSLAPLGELVALASASTDFAGDLRHPEQVAQTVLTLRPDVIVNAAAHTAVDKAESEPELARMVNATAPGAIAQAAQQVGALMVHYSTDYVFDGSGERPWQEDDATGPLSVYGRTKLDGERQASSALPSVTIARTSVVFGPHKNNFVQWVRRSLRDGKPVRAAHDQWVTPTCTRDLALQVLALVEAGAQGVYHTAGAERLSRVEMALRIAAHDGLDAALVDPVPMESLPWVARRPRDASLDTSKIARLRRPMAFDEALDTLGPLEATA
jgi:dTDP-4-dehydrorhamnose reductase